MFEKILAVLPYNPSLVHQLSFYSRRMREEASIRRTGMIFLVLAFMIQFFAVLSPPQSTSASSNNDLVNGGISSAANAAAYCYNNTAGYKAIMNHYGINCSDISAASTTTITVANNNYYSAGRLPFGVAGETPVNAGGVQIYFRPLREVSSSATFRALHVHNSSGQSFYILYACGNLVSVGLPTVETFTPGTVSTPTLPTPTPTPTPTPHPAPTPTPAPTPAPTPTPTPGAAPEVSCTGLTADVTTGVETLTTRLTASYSANQANLVNGITFDFGDGVVYKHNGVIIDHTYTNTGKTTATYTAKVTINTTLGDRTAPVCQTTITVAPKAAPVCQYNSSLPADSPECKSCDKSVSTADKIACISVHKSATNVTANIVDANNTTANPNDVITYTLSAQNSGKAGVDGYIFQENLSDVLDYATVKDLHGGTISSDGIVSWPAETIAAGATATHQVTVTVKSVIPQTPVGSTDPHHFDMIMTNVYGNAVNIKVPGTPTKTIETAAATLPNTGPGTTLFLAAAIVIIGGYFYGRARVLAEESDLAIKETANV